MSGLRDILMKAVTAGLKSAVRSQTGSSTTRRRSSSTRSTRSTTRSAGSASSRSSSSTRSGDARGYLGEFGGRARISYSPADDGNADPGEVVWTWVPYEEDPSRGKDRPVLVIGRDGRRVLGLMLSSQDHDRDAAQERRHGREWMDVGTGEWDRERRPSEVRLDRVMLFDPNAIRREGGRLSKAVFEQVGSALRDVHGWN